MREVFVQALLQYLQTVGGSASWIAIMDNVPPETRPVAWRTLRELQHSGVLQRVVTKREPDPDTQLYVDLVQEGEV